MGDVQRAVEIVPGTEVDVRFYRQHRQPDVSETPSSGLPYVNAGNFGSDTTPARIIIPLPTEGNWGAASLAITFTMDVAWVEDGVKNLLWIKASTVGGETWTVQTPGPYTAPVSPDTLTVTVPLSSPNLAYLNALIAAGTTTVSLAVTQNATGHGAGDTSSTTTVSAVTLTLSDAPQPWLRKYFPSDQVRRVEIESLERGGYSNGTVELLSEWESMVLDGSERIDVYLNNVLAFRGDVRLPESHLEIPEYRLLQMYGRVAAGGDWEVEGRYVYPVIADLSAAATDLYNDVVLAYDPTCLSDIQTTGGQIQPGVVFDQVGKSLAEAMNALCDLAPNQAIWGFDTAPDPSGSPIPLNRFYIRPRATVAKYHYAAGANVKALVYPLDTTQIVNKYHVIGGPPLQSNLITDGGFEYPVAPDENHGNLLGDGNFDLSVFNYTHSFFGLITTGGGGSDNFWTMLGGASIKDTVHPGGGGYTPGAPTWLAQVQSNPSSQGQSGNWWVALDNPGETAQQTVGVDYTRVLRAAGWVRRGTVGVAAVMDCYVDGLNSSGTVVTTIGHPSNPFDPSSLPDSIGDTVYTRVTWDADFTAHSTVTHARIRFVGGTPCGTGNNDGVLVDTCGLWYRDFAVQNAWNRELSASFSTPSAPASPEPVIDWTHRASSAGDSTPPLRGNYCVKMTANPATSGGWVALIQEGWSKVKGAIFTPYTIMVQYRVAGGVNAKITCGAYAWQSDNTIWAVLEGSTFVGGSDGEWHTAFATINIQNTEVDLQPWIRVYDNGGTPITVYFDNVMLIEGAPPLECTEFGDQNFWEGDSYEWIADATNSSLTLNPSSLADPATGSIAKYGVRSKQISQPLVVDRPSAIAYLSGLLSSTAGPAIEGRLELSEYEGKIGYDGLVKIHNLGGLTGPNPAPPADQPLAPAKINYVFDSDGSATEEIDLNNERPNMALLFIEERTAAGLNATTARSGAASGAPSGGGGSSPYNGGSSGSGAAQTSNVALLAGAAQQISAATLFGSASDTTALAIQRFTGQTADLFQIYDESGNLLGEIHADGSQEFDFPSGFAGKPITVKVNGSEVFSIHADGTVWVDGVQLVGAVDATATVKGILQLDGDLAGTAAAPALAALSPDPAGTYGDATHVPEITVDTKGRVTGVTLAAISGGGGALSTGTASKTTASLASGATETGSMTAWRAALLLRVTTDRPARVRLYGTAAYRDADLSRAIGTDPTGEHGVLLDLVTTGSTLAFDLAPLVNAANADATTASTLYYSIENMDTGASTVTATIGALVMET